MKVATKPNNQIRINPTIKSNPTDPFIQKKIEKATQVLKGLKEPFVG